MADGERGKHAAPDPDPDPRLSPQVLADNRQPGTAAPPKEPGWYPVRSNPNEQTYWDGTDWTGRRRWSAGTGWTEVGPYSVATSAVPPAMAVPRMSANPYAPYAPQPTSTTTVARPVPGVTVGIFLLICAAVAMMVGSVGTWVSSSTSFSGISLFGTTAGAGTAVSSALSGVTDGISSLIGLNGYITLIAAAVVLVFAGLIAVSDDLSVRLMGFVFAVVSLGLSTYAVVRLAQKLNRIHTPHGVTLGIGWGLVLTLGAALVATLISLFELTKNR
jgi:hypothetical protein